MQNVYTSVAAMLHSRKGARGAGETWRAGQHTYTEAETTAGDHHLTTAGGVKLYVLRGVNGYNVQAFNAAGDGTTPDTDACQAAIDAAGEGGSIYFPRPDVAYSVTSLVPSNRRLTFFGDGPWVSCLKGRGTAPVFQLGDGAADNQRDFEFHNLSIVNENAGRCVSADFSPNLRFHSCRLSSTNAETIYVRFSWRVTIRDCIIEGNGNFWAMSFTNNVNGLLIDGNWMSGGVYGKTLRISSSKSIAVTNNIIESSGEGCISIGADMIDGGYCEGVQVSQNYFEQCRNPIVLGETHLVRACEVRGNRINNGALNNGGTTALVTFGRFQSASIIHNMFIPQAQEYIFHWIHEASTQDCFKLDIRDNTIFDPGAGILHTSGATVDDVNIRSKLGGSSYVELCEDISGDYGTPVTASSRGLRHFTTAKIDLSALGTHTPGVQWLSSTAPRIEFGGKIFSVELIEAEGTLTDIAFYIGNSVNGQHYNMCVMNLGQFALNKGYADLTSELTADIIFPALSERPMEYRTFKAVEHLQTGSFRIRIGFRVS